MIPQFHISTYDLAITATDREFQGNFCHSRCKHSCLIAVCSLGGGSLSDSLSMASLNPAAKPRGPYKTTARLKRMREILRGAKWEWTIEEQHSEQATKAQPPCPLAPYFRRTPMALAPDCQVGRSSQQVLCLCLQGKTCHTFAPCTPWGRRHVRSSTINIKVNFYNHFCAEWPTFPLALGDFIILRRGSKRSTFCSSTRYISRQSQCKERDSPTSLQLPSNYQHPLFKVTFKENARNVYLLLSNHAVPF